MTEHR